MKTLGTILAVISLVAFYLSFEKFEEIEDIKKGQGWLTGRSVNKVVGVIGDVVTGQWVGAATGVVDRILDRKEAKDDLEKAEARYEIFLIVGVLSGVLSLIFLSLNAVRSSKKSQKLNQELAFLKEETKALRKEADAFKEAQVEMQKKTGEVKKRRVFARATLIVVVLTVSILLVGIWSHQRLTGVSTAYVQSKMGKDAELVKLRQVTPAGGGIFVVYAEFSYQDNKANERVTTSWELDLDPLKGTVERHRMGPGT